MGHFTPHPVSRRHFMALAAATLAAAKAPFALGAESAMPDVIHASPWQSHNPFLSGPVAPVFDERDDANLRVEGVLPAVLNGVFMRNGPNPQFEPDAHYLYPLDGTGMVHAIYLRDGAARYRNRWVVTEELARERAAGKRLYASFMSNGPHANLANTNIMHHAGRFLALYEGGEPYRLDRELATRGLFSFGGMLPGVLSAHPKIDPATGELLSISYDMDPVSGGSRLFYIRADARGRLDRMVPFPSPWPAMVHDIAMTEHYLVAIVAPLVFGASSQAPADWLPDRGTRVALVPRNATAASDVRWIEGPPFFNWHFINAFEDHGRIHVALPWYNRYSLDKSPRTLQLHRLEIDPQGGTVKDEILDDQICEFGRINDAYLGRPAQYGYVGMRMPRPGEHPLPGTFEAIARYDLRTGQKDVYRFEPGTTVCEPVFAPDPDGPHETDGFILTFTQDAGRDTSRFMILDARHLEGGPIATIHLPRRVPAGLHGSWTAA